MRHTELAPAKVNLALHVLGRRDDGYHELDSIVAFADVADRLTFTPSDTWSLEILGPFARGLSSSTDNLVLRAANAFATGHPPSHQKYRIALEKNLPIASGIGGGSADAAACLRALAVLAGMKDKEKLEAIATTVGADVPVCLVGRTCRMRGTGERIELLDGMAPMPAVLVNPGVPLNTGEVFAGLGLKPGAGAFAGLAAGADLATSRNDLAQAALALAPEIADVTAALEAEPGLRFARMSGSGATCFGIFSSAETARQAAGRISHDHAQWWVMPTVIG